MEYAKAAPEDLLIKINVCNWGPEPAALHVLPTLWFRNTWSWSDGGTKPLVRALEADGRAVIHTHHSDPLFQESLEDYYLYCEGDVRLLFTENETNIRCGCRGKRVMGDHDSYSDSSVADAFRTGPARRHTEIQAINSSQTEKTVVPKRFDFSFHCSNVRGTILEYFERSHSQGRIPPK